MSSEHKLYSAPPRKYTVSRSFFISMLRVDINVWFSRRSFSRRNIIYYYRFKWPSSVLAIFSPIFPGLDQKWYFCFLYRAFSLDSSSRYRKRAPKSFKLSNFSTNRRNFNSKARIQKKSLFLRFILKLILGVSCELCLI